MELNLERIVIELMMNSHVSFFFRVEDNNECKNVFLKSIADYLPGITYTPSQQHTNWFQYAAAKVSGRTIHYETPFGVTGVMADDDWYFTHNIKFTVGEFKNHTQTYNQVANPLHRYAVRAMVGCGVRFTKHGDSEGFVLTSENFDREFPYTTFLPHDQVENWSSLAIAKIAGVQLEWSFSIEFPATTAAARWLPVLDSDFDFGTMCKYRFPDAHVNVDRVIHYNASFASKDVQAATSSAIDELQEISHRGRAVEVQGVVAHNFPFPDAPFAEVAEQVLTNHQLIVDLLADIDAIRRLTDRGYNVTKEV